MLILIIFGILLTNLGHQYLQKYLSDRVDPHRITLWMFGVSLGVAICFQLIRRGGIDFPSAGIPIALTAAVNGVAAWLFIKAVQINMTKSTLLLPISTLLSVFLIAVFLGEWRLLDPRSASGVLLLLGGICAGATVWLFQGKPTRQSALNNDAQNKKWLFAILGAVLLWGLVNMLLKFFASTELPADIFLVPWYGGALISQIILWAVIKAPIQTKKSEPKIALLTFGLLTIGSLALSYYALAQNPGILMLSAEEMVKLGGGVVIGLFVFNESKALKKREWLGLLFGAASLIALIGSNAVAP